jgi:hypothetical protein
MYLVSLKGAKADHCVFYYRFDFYPVLLNVNPFHILKRTSHLGVFITRVRLLLNSRRNKHGSEQDGHEFRRHH